MTARRQRLLTTLRESDRIIKEKRIGVGATVLATRNDDYVYFLMVFSNHM
jgi:hypothetical protein